MLMMDAVMDDGIGTYVWERKEWRWGREAEYQILICVILIQQNELQFNSRSG